MRDFRSSERYSLTVSFSFGRSCASARFVARTRHRTWACGTPRSCSETSPAHHQRP